MEPVSQGGGIVGSIKHGTLCGVGLQGGGEKNIATNRYEICYNDMMGFIRRMNEET